MPSSPLSSPIARTVIGAGAVWARSVAIGLAFAVLAGGGLLFAYLWRLAGTDPQVAAAGPDIFRGLQPILQLLVGLLLLTFVPGYWWLGILQGRQRALARVVAAHGDQLAALLAGVVATRLDSMPRIQGGLDGAGRLLSADALAERLAAAAGSGRMARRVMDLLVRWLPLADLLPSETPGDGLPGRVDLRTVLAPRIAAKLHDVGQPSYRLAWIVCGLHALVFAAGLWVTH